ncbi:YggT family protein [Rhizobium sp. SG_E_25_P2]|jgi:YggT family protein|uniref:YggT family protein n=1 Tax=Rhizobium sp. SG_E_25_P2 TaxID=2879942 RepID=UPI002475D9B7|nr:YggT family protein [Rhizobium sp. SG_E_25_P2]MDH6267593.1 YggT family protein [Rhizobium sp. SG_E_25_P2]
MLAILNTILFALNLYIWILIASAIFSWLYAFNVINSRNQFVGMIGQALSALTEPVLRPIRRFMPNLGGVDISPIVVFILIYFLQQVIILYLYPMAAGY